MTSQSQAPQTKTGHEHEARLIDAGELARVHCDALHSATHPPKMPRPCLSSQEQMQIVAEAYNALQQA